jgi:hypothetical protein
MAPLILNLGHKWMFVVIIRLRSLYVQETIPVPIVYEAGCSTEPVWTVGEEKTKLTALHRLLLLLLLLLWAAIAQSV